MNTAKVISNQFEAIHTKYLGPTNSRGSRVKASASDGNSVTIGYDYALSRDGVHDKAAETLCAKMGWTGKLCGGGSRHGRVYVFVG